MDSELEALKRAVEKAGGQSALAQKLDQPDNPRRRCKQQNVWSWLNESKRAPAKWVLAIEALTGVPRHELRPDMCPPPNQSGAAA